MPKSEFQLLGHDNPLGYPAPLVPVGLLDGRLIAVYASDQVTEVELDEDNDVYVRHDDALKEKLKHFDYMSHRLFGFGRNDVELYAIDEEGTFFLTLLKRREFSERNPFLRLSLAKATGKPYLTMWEMGSCSRRLQSIAPNIITAWYGAQLSSLQMYPGLAPQHYLFPATWQELDLLLSEGPANTSLPDTSRRVSFGSQTRARVVKKIIYKELRQIHRLSSASGVALARRQHSEQEEFEALIYLSQLKGVVAESLKDITNNSTIQMRNRYLSSLNVLISKTEESLTHGKPLKRSYISKALTLHTRLFNELTRQKAYVGWDRKSWQAVSLIGNKLWQRPEPLTKKDVAIEFYSCFISYTHADKSFARRLHDALQGRGIRCWLDEHQLLPGADIHEEVDRGIRLWDKMLLCCSKDSLTSWWVNYEIEKAFEKEQRLMKERGEKALALIPLNLDGYLFSKEFHGGAAHTLRSRLAADFMGWATDDKKFEEQFERLVRALRADAGGREGPPPRRL